MTTASIIPIWRYHLVRQLRSASTWVVLTLVLVIAGTQGLVTEHMPAVMESLSGPGLAEVLKSTLPQPSWQQSYLGWLKNLSQVITLAILVVNAMVWSALITSGDIPFILTKNIRRSHYLASATVICWLLTTCYAIIGAALAWAGSLIFFPDAPLRPAILATGLWVLEVIVISAAQLLVATIKPSVAPALLTGIALYLIMSMAAAWQKIAAHTPLALASLRNQVITQAPVDEWLWPVATSVAIIACLSGTALYKFNRTELS